MAIFNSYVSLPQGNFVGFNYLYLSLSGETNMQTSFFEEDSG